MRRIKDDGRFTASPPIPAVRSDGDEAAHTAARPSSERSDAFWPPPRSVSAGLPGGLQPFGDRYWWYRCSQCVEALRPCA